MVVGAHSIVHHEAADEMQQRRPDAAARQSSSVGKRCSNIWSHLTLSEISGSLGDLGTFIPLYVALCRQGSLYAAPALFFAGIANIATGFFWDIPMCVQPMKSIAAVALVEVLSRAQVTTAGIWMGLFLSLLGIGQGIEWVNRIVPPSVVCGMQLGVGIHLAIKGFHLVSDLPWWIHHTKGDDDGDDGGGSSSSSPDCILLALACTVACMYYLRERSSPSSPPPLPRRVSDVGGNNRTGDNSNNGDAEADDPPASREKQQHRPTVALYLFVLGAMIAVVEMVLSDNNNENDEKWTFPPTVATWALRDTSWTDWKIGLLEGAIPQLPLSTLNSVISVCCLAHTLYPERRRYQQQDDGSSDAVVSRRDVCLSVGIMNLLLCPLGAMPNCHGAGGLAGQHKFGARYGTSVIFLGINKILIAVIFGSKILPFLEKFPSSILGVMLAIAGLELARTGFMFLVQSSAEQQQYAAAATSRAVGDDDEGVLLLVPLPAETVLRTNAGVALLTAAVILGLKKTHYGALAGLVGHLVYGNGWSECRQAIISSWGRRRIRYGGGTAVVQDYQHVVQQESSSSDRAVEEHDDEHHSTESNHVL